MIYEITSTDKSREVEINADSFRVNYTVGVVSFHVAARRVAIVVMEPGMIIKERQ